MTLGIDEPITLDEGMRLLREVIDERGADYVYGAANDEYESTCVYRWEEWLLSKAPEGAKVGEAACGIGVVIDRLGLLDTLCPLVAEGTEAVGYQYNNDAVLDLIGETDLNVDHYAQTLFHRFQLGQDMGKPWGEAYNDAVELAQEQLRQDKERDAVVTT